MLKKSLCVLLLIVLVFVLAAGAGYGVAWYQSNHIFIEGDAYPLTSTELDLREKALTIHQYEEIQAQLPECTILWMVPFQGNLYPSDSTSITVSSVTREDLDLLHFYFPKLRELNAAASSDYALLADFQREAPHVSIAYQIDLGGTSHDLDTQELTLNPGEYTMEALTENLTFLRELKMLTLKTPDITLEQLNALKEVYPAVEIHCTVEILGTEYDTETTELDLSAMTSADLEAVSQKLGMLPNLTAVDLTDIMGDSQLSKEDVKKLMDLAPQVVFDYSFEFFGQTLSTASEEVVVKDVKIGDENEGEIRLALDLMTNCKRFVLDNCKMSNEVMAKLREDYRGRTKVVWRIWYTDKHASCLTDVEVIKAVYDLTDSTSKDLIYCEDVIHMDAGHNEWLRTCEFVSGMPKLESIILSGSLVGDLTPFKNCPNLKFLEVAFCEQIEDLTPLKGCKDLQMLNISNTHVKDLSPLDDLKLTNFIAKLNPSGNSRVPAEEQARFKELHPDCWAEFEGSQPYGPGWRYAEDGLAFLPYYAMLRDVLQYDREQPLNKAGYYLDTYSKKD